MKIVERIKLARLLLGETNEQFAARFGKNESADRAWEKGENNAPHEVIEFCEDIIEKLQVCPACKGTGVFNKSQDQYCILFGDEAFETIFPIGKMTGTIERTRVPRFKMIAGEPKSFLLPDEKQ